MALNINALAMLAPYLRDAKILSLGYPDLLVSKDQLKKMFGVDTTKFTNGGEWHGIGEPLPDTAEFFESLNSTFECVDIYQETGLEKVLDLNYAHDLGSFDVVIDSGTIEHCFNIGQAIINAAKAVKVGGVILHTPPMSMMNHGFYNVCPTLLHDFYTQNEWQIDQMKAVNCKGLVPFESVKRFSLQPEVSIYCLVKRVKDGELKYPTQTKYLEKKR
jgi:SAM-dependent methyltransferase